MKLHELPSSFTAVTPDPALLMTQPRAALSLILCPVGTSRVVVSAILRLGTAIIKRQRAPVRLRSMRDATLPSLIVSLLHHSLPLPSSPSEASGPPSSETKGEKSSDVVMSVEPSAAVRQSSGGS